MVEAWDEASSAHERLPASSISRSRRWRSIASGRVEPGRPAVVADAALDVAEQARAQAGLLEDRVQQEGGRRLAVRTGHAGDGKLVRGVAEELGRDDRHGGAHGLDHELRGVYAHRALDDECDGARGERFGRKVVAVHLRSRDGEEERTRPDRARVVGEVGDLAVGRGRPRPAARAARRHGRGASRAECSDARAVCGARHRCRARVRVRTGARHTCRARVRRRLADLAARTRAVGGGTGGTAVPPEAPARRGRRHSRASSPYRRARASGPRQRRASGGTWRYCSPNRAICANAGAATTPPQIISFGSSTMSATTSRGLVAGTKPTNEATYLPVP